MGSTVAIMMGSDSDMKYVEPGIQILKDFGLEPTVRILSAHRTPEDLIGFVRDAEKAGYQVLIAAAGGAAHLAGAVAAHTTLPVIGVPIPSTPLSGMDALLATVQMPSGVPVACMAIGSAGASNAALFAIEILALNDPQLKDRLVAFRRGKADGVRREDAKLNF